MGQLILQQKIQEVELSNYENYSNWVYEFIHKRGIDLQNILETPFVYSFLSRTDLFNYEKHFSKNELNLSKETIEYIQNLFYNPNQYVDKKVVFEYLKLMLDYKQKTVDYNYYLILLSTSNDNYSSDLYLNDFKLSTYHTIENSIELNNENIIRETINVFENGKIIEKISTEGKSQISFNEKTISITRINYDEKVINLIKSNLDLINIAIKNTAEIKYNTL